MNALRERRHAEQRQHQLVAEQPTVAATVAGEFPTLGPDAAVVVDCVAEVLCEVVLAGDYLDDELEHVKKRWVHYAHRRVLDVVNSAEVRRRDPDPVEEHERALTALAVSASGELGGVSEADWRLRELFAPFRGDARRWLEVWSDHVVAGHRQPRGLAEILGWSAEHTEWVSRDTRKKFLGLLEKRADGRVCHERRAMLDPFTLATTGRPLASVGMDDDTFVEVLVHIAGCEECRLAWHVRRRSLVGRCLGLLGLPFGHAAAAAAALHAKLTGLFGSAHGASHTIRQRLGFGGGGAVVTGSGAATISGKAAALCTATVCAVGAGGAAVVGGGSALIPAAILHPHHATHHPKPAPVAHLTSYTPPSAPTPAPTTTTAAPAHQAAPTPTRAPAPKPTATVAQQPSAPGDLPPASSTSAGATPSSSSPSSSPSSSGGGSSAPARSTTSPASSQGCAPGDLGC